MTKAAELLDRVPPSAKLAEDGVLGSILLLPDVLDDMALILTPADFLDQGNAALYTRLLAMGAAGKRIDRTLLIAALQKADEYDAIGGAVRLGELFQSVPHAANASHYAELVRSAAAKRELLHAGSETVKLAHDDSLDAPEAISKAEAAILGIRDRRMIGKSCQRTASELLHAAMDGVNERMSDKTPPGQRTGFADVDSLFTLRDEELLILAARPSMGKSALALQLAVNVAEYAPVIFFSLEMTGISLADRLLSCVAQVDSHRMMNGNISQLDRDRLVEAAGELSLRKLVVTDAPMINCLEIAAEARRFKRQQKGLGLIVVDYLQLVQPEDHRAPREQQVAGIAKRLKSIARELQCPLLCVAQLNRQAEQGSNRPKLSHLRESGAIEQDADVVLFIHREEYFATTEKDKDAVRGQAELIVAKQRSGPQGVVKLIWREQFTRFDNAAHRDQQEPSGDAYEDNRLKRIGF